MSSRTIKIHLGILLFATISNNADAQLSSPLKKLWQGEAWFQEQPEAIGNFGDHMHFLSMFWDYDPQDTPGDPHFKAYYISSGFSTRLARSYDGISFTDAGTVLPLGAPGAWDDRIASFSSVWKDDGTYYLVYEGAGHDSMWPGDIGLATSSDGVDFAKQGRILTHLSGTYESANIGTPSLHKEDDLWYLYYHGFDGTDVQLGVATGTDLATNMTRVQPTPIIPTSVSGWDSGTVGKRSRLVKEGEFYYMAYEGSTDQPYDSASWSTGIARSTDLLNWERMPMNPVLPQSGSGFSFDGPEMIYVEDDLFIYYRTGANQTRRAKLVSTVVSNFGFETGNYDDWGYVTMDGVVGDNGPSAPGNNAASMTVVNPQSYEQAVSKSIAILSGEVLDFSFDYKTLPGASGDWHVQLRYWDGVGANDFSDGGGGMFLGEHTITLGATEDAWQTQYLTDLLNPNPAATHVDIRVIANAFGAFDGTALVDNFLISTIDTADFDLDADIDGADFLSWQRGFGSANETTRSTGDASGDKMVDDEDFSVWQSQFGMSSSSPISATIRVPEPSSWLFLALSMAYTCYAETTRGREKACKMRRFL